MLTDGVGILVVDDEEVVADAYALHLGREYETMVAYTGEDALEELDQSVDIVLLDRRMPGLTGDNVLQKIRENGYDCRVIMVSAVDPDFDIVDMPFDDYLCKPVRNEDLYEAVERQVAAMSHDAPLNEYISVKSTLSVLENEKSPQELAGSHEIEQIRDRATQLETDLKQTVGNLDDIPVDISNC
jgi:DNA-binding response OmpR family regulator